MSLPSKQVLESLLEYNPLTGVLIWKPRGDIAWDARFAGKWHAQIGVKGKRVSLGHFDIIEDAIAARKAAEQTYGYHRNHGK